VRYAHCQAILVQGLDRLLAITKIDDSVGADRTVADSRRPERGAADPTSTSSLERL
jgi:hypothetical protein